ncbi:zinc finger CCHC domain-containing protein 3-like [Anguilla anguilla]|uniref:zinc finger CCHC domain-containing protein 3-like n=1 Tax=Anguilla anguilla TaxID=7936 RepID=UPI0015B22EAD|nr:zinc finger CCHC domain-containing protein 3-like [Anguilla anguilla]
MATGAQPGVRRHNAVRMTLQNSGEGGSDASGPPQVAQGAKGAAVRGAAEPAATGGASNAAAPNVNRRVTGMTRLEFSRAVLQRAMGFVPGDLNCLVKVPGNADIFEISFRSANILERFWNLYREGKGKAPLSVFDVEPLSDIENKVVTVQFYNEAVQDHDVSTWLSRYGLVRSEARRVLDEDGVWTGARKWLVQLKPDPSAPGGVCHIPSSITLGRHRGVVFYYGMPKLCRNCGELGHLAAACTVVKCKTCGGEHETRACRDPKPCNLCGARGHLFRDCPLSYANRARNTAPPPPSAAPPSAPPPPPPTPMPRTRPPTPTPSQPGSPTPHAQTPAQDPTPCIPTAGTPNSTVSPALDPTNPVTVTVKEEPDSDTPIVVLESDSSTSESDTTTPLGVVVAEEAEVREVAREFYGGLYSESPSDGALMDTFLGGLDRRLGDELMDSELSTEELTRAVLSLNQHKAPGPDGIPGGLPKKQGPGEREMGVDHWKELII